MRPKVICFDTSVWNALLNNEAGRDIGSIAVWIDLLEKQKVRLLVPAVVICEIAAHPDSRSIALATAIFQQSTVSQADITIPIAQKAGELRRRVKNDGGKNIKTPDALIIATGDHLDADFLMSFDNGILRCNGLYDLKIKIGLPEDGHDQRSLPFVD